MFTIARARRAGAPGQCRDIAARHDDAARETGDAKNKPDAIAIEAYVTLDFSPHGAAAQALMAHAPAEAADTDINLSDIAGADPPNLTQAMQDWYTAHVAPRRQEALIAVRRDFGRLGPGGTTGFALLMREDTLAEALLRNRLKLYETHRERFHTLNRKIQAVQTDMAGVQRLYEDRKAELGRDARTIDPLLYLATLAAIILGLGAALNLHPFAALPWATPAIAWSATLLVGAATGMAAHWHGMAGRQYAWYFAPCRDGGRRRTALCEIIGGAVALSVALGFVSYARGPAGLLLGNALAYLMGVSWTYLLHDADPGFARSRTRIRALGKQLAALRQLPERELSRSLAGLDACHRKALDGARRNHVLLAAQPGFRETQYLFDRIRVQDDAVLNLLLAYRDRLVHALPVPHVRRFRAWNDEPHQRSERIDAAGYQRREIRLKYLEN